jgi:prepilin-type N-terminal cleavage/methylation domain-containing protein
MTPSTHQRRRQTRTRGFSLLELLVAMMIIAVIATLGFSQFRKHSAQARFLKAQDDLKIVAEGLDQYWLKHGVFPDLGSYEAMVDSNSPLVKENLIKVNMSPMDPFRQPYEGKSTRLTYEIKFAGDPNSPEDAGPIVRTPSQVTTSTPGVPTGAPKADAAAGDAGVKK